MTRVLCVLILTAGLAAAQTLTEHAIGAAGGSAAGVAGKPVSNAADTIFGKLKTQTAEAAEIKPAKPSATPAPEATQAGFSRGASRPARAARSSRASRREAGRVPDSFAEPSAVAPPASEPPRVEVLAAVTVGTSRQELLAKAGNPGSRISMGEDGHLVEIFRYSANGATIASVRLADGSVTGVQLSAGP